MDLSKLKNNLKTKVLVTGATGFIGSHIVSECNKLGYEVIGISRSKKNSTCIPRDISGDTDWLDLLDGVDIIIHCAAAVHNMKMSEDIKEDFKKINLEGTLNLARQAKNTAKRFIFLSSIKVNGEETFENQFLADDIPNPQDSYAYSKNLAEKGLKEIAKSSKMDVTIIRPPLVYGPNPKGNLEKIAGFIKKNYPLPFRRVCKNSRSLVYIGNLVDFIILCAEHEAAANEIFLISDDHDLDTFSLIKLIASSLDKKPIIFSIPIFILKSIFIILGKKKYGTRLLGNLSVDVSKNKDLLGWRPKHSVKDGFNQSFK